MKSIHYFLLLLHLYVCQGFVYNLGLKEHVTGASVGLAYNNHAPAYQFFVDVPENETNCEIQAEIGSAHDASCSFTSVTTGPNPVLQLLATGTIGDSGQSQDVCLGNGGYACAAAYADSETFEAASGDTVYYSHDAQTTEGENYYEFLVLLVNATNDMPVWGRGRRGIASNGTNTYVIGADGMFYLRFYYAGYLFSSTTLPRTLAPDITFSDIQIENAESRAPTDAPTESPSATPSVSPTKTPTSSPTASPIGPPTSSPSSSPSVSPSVSPTKSPSSSPSLAPTLSPSLTPCAPGRFRSVNDTCLPCPQNTFSDTINANECIQCPPGFFTESEESTSCLEEEYTSTSHLPPFSTITPICNDTLAAAITQDNTAYRNEVLTRLTAQQAATCIRELYTPFIRRVRVDQPGDQWGAPASQTFPTGLLRAQSTGLDTLIVGARARLVEIAKPASEVLTVDVPCVCDSAGNSNCLKKLYFTSDDPFGTSPVAQWVEYGAGELVHCNNSLATVEVASLPFEGGFQNRRLQRRLQFGSDDPVHGSNGPDETHSPSISPTQSPTPLPTRSPTPLPTTSPTVNPTTNTTTVSPSATAAGAKSQPFETSILAIMLYTMAAIVIASIFAYVSYTFYKLSQESSVQGIGESADLPQIVNEFLERFHEE